ncbi:hypothetical protein CNEO4_450029 [Clostridium neonatale]|nr:hypothetical protein CNEO4_450029 [Clostridium neonatale]CAI3727772.1 hypothetical protein CNEO4_910026 [Clostridium neonatale]
MLDIKSSSRFLVRYNLSYLILLLFSNPISIFKTILIKIILLFDL